MAKAQVAARFVTEMAPPQVVSVMRRRKMPRSLDTIVEDDRELQLAYGDHHHHHATASAAASLMRAGARTGSSGFMRELSSCFSGNGVHGPAAGGGWKGTRNKVHGRRAVYAHQMHGN